MRASVIALCALFALIIPAQAQQPEVSGWPINNCGEITGKWNNPYDEVVDLTLFPDCRYVIGARGRTGNGMGNLQDGTLTILYKDGETGGTFRFVLRRSGENLAGKVSFQVFVISLSPPIQFFPIKK